MKYLITLLCVLGFILPGLAQSTETTAPIIFIYDASGSMWGQLEGKTKMEIASEVLTTTVGTLGENQQVGVVAYGHRQKGDCKDVETLVSMENTSKTEVTKALKNIKPLGKTPLAYSARMVIDQLKASGSSATIILITDGVESCNGDICNVVSEAKKAGIDFKLHIVGFGLKKGETGQLECAAKAGDGMYYDASSAAGLGEVLNEATQQTVTMPEGNVTFYAVKNGEPVDAWVKAYDLKSKRRPISVRTYRDTASVFLPPSTYDLEVKPLEGSKISAIMVRNIESFEDKVVHQTISFDGGTLRVHTTNNGEGWDSTVKILDQDGKTVTGGRTYKKPKDIELNAGVYDVKVMGLRINGRYREHVIEDVELSSMETKDVIHEFATGIANLGCSESGQLVDVTVSIYDAKTDESVAAGRSYTSESSNPREFILTPGNYKVRLRGRKNGADTTKWFEFSVKQGETYTKMYEW